MTAILIDTHVAFWLATDSSRLGPDARAALVARPGQVFLSVASIWETAIKQSIGKLTIPDGLWDQTEQNGVRTVEITREDAEAVAQLPFHHRDPFDRMLIAQAARLKAELMTDDTRIDRYDVRTVPAST